VPPPSRGKLNGARAPSAKAGRETVDAPAFFGGGIAALAFDPAAIGRTGFAALGNFNAFDEGLCDAFETELPVCLVFAVLLALLAVGLRVFKGVIFAAVVARARVAFPAESLGDFSRVFLDIRLPFVAFRGSIIELLRQAGIKPTAGQV
jgi:hypothetical protein